MSGSDAPVAFDGAIRELLRSGYAARFRAAGDSMYPTIADGDYVNVEPAGERPFSRGEVVLIDAPRGLTAHRIVRVTAAAAGRRWVTTRGDNSLRNDPPITETAVLGRVTSVERVGNHGKVTPFMTRSAMIVVYTRTAARRLRRLAQLLTGRRTE